MTYAQSVTDYLAADVALAALAPGGVHNYSGLGRNGLNRIQTSSAFNATTGIIKCLVIVYEFNEQFTGEAVSPETGYMSNVTPLSVWVYDNGDNGYDNVAAAADRIYALLAFWRIPNGLQVLWHNTLKDKREIDLKNASYYRLDWRVHD